MTTAANPIRVLVVDDSRTQRTLLVGLLQAAGDFVVVGTEGSGTAAITTAERLRPDVIAMDIHLPGIDGFEAARQIMQHSPTRIVLMSSNKTTAQRDEQARTVGALAIIHTPSGLSADVGATERTSLIRTLRLMARVPVVTRHARRPPVGGSMAQRASRPQIVAVAASTGGPAALQTILRDLGPGFPLPVLIVQHIAHGFAPTFGEWLQAATGVPCHIAERGMALQGGHLYIAPDDQHLIVEAKGIAGLQAAASHDPFCPSADVLFDSVARVYRDSALGIVLTGMGQDGVEGLRALSGAGSLTLAQDEASCVVYGMPRAAVAAGVIARIAPLHEIAALTCGLTGCLPHS